MSTDNDANIRPIKAIDFFCGAGGLTRGLLDAGISVVAGVDSDERLRDTYAENNQPSSFVAKRVEDVDIDQMWADYSLDDGDVLYAACTPCQPFSSLNRSGGADKRVALLEKFGEIVKRRPPDFVLVENVPGLRQAHSQEIYDSFVEQLHSAGLTNIASDMVNAADHGVPQVRKRFILLASRRGSIALPNALPGEPVSVRSAIEKFPGPASKAGGKIANHIYRPLAEHHKTIVEAVPKDGGSRRDIEDESILLKCHQGRPFHHRDVFGRMAWDSPAPTLTARCTDVYCGRFIHPDEDRGITVREAAALQTFDMSYVFHANSIFHAAAQVGNAVPVKLAERLGKSVRAAQ